MILTLEKLRHFRRQTFRTEPGLRVIDKTEAVKFVNSRGFVFFWPIRDHPLPSLWAAVAGERPVADAHDDPGHVTWGWKDELLGKQEWYYAKVLRKRSTMIAMQVAPYFYALSENYGSPDEDYLTLYEQGRLTQEARVLYQVVLQEGPLDTVALRKAAHMTSKESDGRFNKALADLQADFKLLPVAVTTAGAWRYAFAYEVVARHYPELPEKAQAIGENQARKVLTEWYYRSLGAAPVRDLRRLFGWSQTQAERAVQALVKDGVLSLDVQVEGSARDAMDDPLSIQGAQDEPWAALVELLPVIDGSHRD